MFASLLKPIFSFSRKRSLSWTLVSICHTSCPESLVSEPWPWPFVGIAFVTSIVILLHHCQSKGLSGSKWTSDVFPPLYLLQTFVQEQQKGVKKKKKANNNNQKLESSSLFTLLPECNLRRCTKNVKNEQIGMSVSVLQGWDGLTRRWSLKCLGLTVLLLTLRAMVLVLILGCKTAHWSTLGRKSFFSDPTSTAEAPMAEASLWPVCAISGLGAFMSSSHSSAWSRLIWRTEFLTTKDVLCQARKCLSPLFTRESENL